MTSPRGALQNAPPPYEDVNLYASDTALQEAVTREGGAYAARRLNAFGIVCGSSEAMTRARLADAHPPCLTSHDRYGRRIDRIDYHPAFHDLMQTSVTEGIVGEQIDRMAPATRTANPGRQVARAATVYLAAQMDLGHLASLSTTAAALAALDGVAGLPDDWPALATSRSYDPRPLPVVDKHHIRLALAIGERHAGTDLRAVATQAASQPDAPDDRAFLISGQKWYVTAPSADGCLVLAQAPAGPSLFVVQRFDPDGGGNGLEITRLKRMAGVRSEAAAEVRFDRALGSLVGAQGEGEALVEAMLLHLRLDASLGATGLMRSGLAHALHFAEHRSSRGRRLIDQPVMGEVLCDLALDVEAAVALIFRLARAFDHTDDPRAEAWRRVMTPASAFLVGRLAPSVLAECLECHGSDAYGDELPLARYVRDVQAPGLAHGPGNILAVEVLSTLQRAPEAVATVMEDLQLACGEDPYLLAAHARLERILCEPRLLDRRGRDLAASLAVLAAGTLLRAHAPPAIADAYIATRLGSQPRQAYGQAIDWADRDAILARATPNR
ncbi:MAG: acyl-CoA dehydrogenase family protein [Hyphomicrobiaceae bacterium]|nr:acyl-CoA dehydrogenase family protein [Hyphomicrobiaceae bacterium]